MCYDLQGKQLWKTQIGNEWMKSFPGSRSGPTIADDLVYVVNGTGNFYCVESENGNVLWSKDFEKDFGGIPTLHGFSEAPVIDGDRVFWVPGGSEHNVLAFNRFTGDIIWTSKGVGERSGYNQGTLISLPGRKIFVTFSAYHLMGFDTETGELLWTQEQDNLKPEERKLGMGDTHCNTVIFDDGFIYYSAGDGNCGVKLSLSEDGSAIEEVWRNKEFDGYMGGILKMGDYLYGTSGSKPELRSFNAETGETTGKFRFGFGALIAADDMMYYYEQRGILRLLKYNEGEVTEVSSFKIDRGSKEHFAHPVINDGILYQRHGNVLMAFNIISDS
jgi:outer membrane protein assembly factor BamB